MPTTKAEPKRRRKTKSDAVAVDTELARFIGAEIDRRGWTQMEAARQMREAASQLSLVTSGQLDGFSTRRLLRMVNTLGHDVRLTIRKARTKRGTTRMARVVAREA